jgi:sec-independent protein translocase protein TatB
VFGLGLTEMLVLVVVGIVVVGPKKLPEMMRTTGRWITKLRRMSTDLRSQSGIDEILRAEGLEKEIRELRSLSRINVMDSLVNAASKPPTRALPVKASTGGASPPPAAGGSTAAATGAPSATVAASAAPAPPGAPPPGAIASSAPGAALPAFSPAAPSSASSPPPRASTPPPSSSAAIPVSAPAPVTLPPLPRVDLPGEEPLADREWPSIGCDAYDALPDDLDEQEEVAAAAAAAASTAPPATDAPATPAEPGAA